MANNNRAVDNQLPNSNVETKEEKLKADVIEDETGKKRVALDYANPDVQNRLMELNWYLGLGNAVFKEVELNKTVKGKAVKFKKTVFDHFEFTHINGKRFSEWLKDTFGEDVRVDPKTKEVYRLVPKDEETPSNPTNNTNTEETQ